MAKILFNQNIDLSGFNFGSSDITYPDNQNNQAQVDNATENSLIYSFVNRVLCDEKYLYGRYKSKSLSGDRFVIYRQTDDDSAKTYIATIGDVTDGLYDYNINNKKHYKYTVETNPASASENIAPVVSLETDYYISPNWNCWSICDIEKNYELSAENKRDLYIPSDNVFLIKNNISPGSISDNLNIIKYNTLGRFSRAITNQQKYDSGSISCMISDIIGYQDIRCGDKLFVIKDEVKTKNDIDNFFVKLSQQHKDDIHNFNGKYFKFSNVSDKYYKYDIESGSVVYILANDRPANWESEYINYYTFSNGTYIVATKQYVILDKKPDNWETAYDMYYTRSDEDGSFIQNKNSEWVDNKYFKLTPPTWSANKYYLKAISCGIEVPTQNVVMNTLETLEQWRNCLSNGKLKLLKAPNGQSWVVQISDQTQLSVEWGAKQYPSTIDFNWQEVLDKNKISIIKW